MNVGRCPRCNTELTLAFVETDPPDPVDVHDRAAWSDAVVAAELREATHKAES